MKLLKQLSLCTILTISSTACSSEQPVNGDRALTIEAALQIVAQASEHIVIDEKVELNALGTLENGIEAFSYNRLWNGDTRASNRVIFIDSNKEYLGAYAVNDFPVKVEGNCLYFPTPSDYGNSICLENGKLPTKVYLDGENPELFR